MFNYPIFNNKYIDGLPLEIYTHRHFRTSKMISELVRIFSKKAIIFMYTTLVIYTCICTFINLFHNYVYMLHNCFIYS